jgi:hypothetical protein
MFDMPENTEKLVDVEAVSFIHVPALQHYPFAPRRLFIWMLKALVIEDRINRFFVVGFISVQSAIFIQIWHTFCFISISA